MSYIDEIDRLSKEIRRLQKTRLAYKKKIQDQCYHLNVKRVYSMPNMSIRDMIDQPSDAYVTRAAPKIKIICTDCGKVLNGNRR
jgi:hypothetical protein